MSYVQWQILEDTSLPLSSSVPGVTVQPMYHHGHGGQMKQHHQQQQQQHSVRRAGGTWSHNEPGDGGHYAVMVTDSGQVVISFNKRA